MFCEVAFLPILHNTQARTQCVGFTAKELLITSSRSFIATIRNYIILLNKQKQKPAQMFEREFGFNFMLGLAEVYSRSTCSRARVFDLNSITCTPLIKSIWLSLCIILLFIMILLVNKTNIHTNIIQITLYNISTMLRTKVFNHLKPFTIFLVLFIWNVCVHSLIVFKYLKIIIGVPSSPIIIIVNNIKQSSMVKIYAWKIFLLNNKYRARFEYLIPLSLDSIVYILSKLNANT